jgi:predicted dienelactone hydrolase
LRRALAAALAVLALCAGLAVPAVAQPAATPLQPTPAAAADPAGRDEALAYTVQDLDWFDASRQRAVPVRLYLPARPDGPMLARPVPLVVFSHGIGGSRNGYSYLGRHWASHGYASLHLQHVGSDRTLWTGNPLGVVGRLQAAAQDGEATARVRDLSFAIDQLLASDVGPRIDASRIVAAGHSYGANTALMSIGARVERAGRVIDLRDARLKAAIVISAPPFYGSTDFGPILGGILVPSLHVTATEDTIRIPGYYSPASDRLSVFEATGGPSKSLAVFAGGSHQIFSDRGVSDAPAFKQQVRAATQALSIAFLRSVFDGDAQGLRDWALHNAGLLARSSIDLH